MSKIVESEAQQLDHFEKLCDGARELFIEKNREYGDSIRFGGVLSACYNIVGAAMRLPKLVFQSPDHGRSAHEKVRDILRDIHNYAVIGLIYMDNDNWLGDEK